MAAPGLAGLGGSAAMFTAETLARTQILGVAFGVAGHGQVAVV